MGKSKASKNTKSTKSIKKQLIVVSEEKQDQAEKQIAQVEATEEMDRDGCISENQMGADSQAETTEEMSGGVCISEKQMKADAQAEIAEEMKDGLCISEREMEAENKVISGRVSGIHQLPIIPVSQVLNRRTIRTPCRVIVKNPHNKDPILIKFVPMRNADKTTTCRIIKTDEETIDKSAADPEVNVVADREVVAEAGNAVADAESDRNVVADRETVAEAGRNVVADREAVAEAGNGGAVAESNMEVGPTLNPIQTANTIANFAENSKTATSLYSSGPVMREPELGNPDEYNEAVDLSQKIPPPIIIKAIPPPPGYREPMDERMVDIGKTLYPGGASIECKPSAPPLLVKIPSADGNQLRIIGTIFPTKDGLKFRPIDQEINIESRFESDRNDVGPNSSPSTSVDVNTDTLNNNLKSVSAPELVSSPVDINNSQNSVNTSELASQQAEQQPQQPGHQQPDSMLPPKKRKRSKDTKNKVKRKKTTDDDVTDHDDNDDNEQQKRGTCVNEPSSSSSSSSSSSLSSSSSSLPAAPTSVSSQNIDSHLFKIPKTPKPGNIVYRFKKLPSNISTIRNGVKKIGECTIRGTHFEKIFISKDLLSIPRSGRVQSQTGYECIGSDPLSPYTCLTRYQKVEGGIRTTNIMIHFKDNPNVTKYFGGNPFEDEGVILDWGEFVRLIALQKYVNGIIQDISRTPQPSDFCDFEKTISSDIIFRISTGNKLFPVEIRKQFIFNGNRKDSTVGYRFTLMEWKKFLRIYPHIYNLCKDHMQMTQYQE
jgi:hypothetical protein